jgi:hypothetical protein
MVIKVYVSCCGGDKAVAAVEEALKQTKVEARIEVVDDLKEVMKAGVLSPPAIRINDRMVASGRVPKVPDLVKWLVDAASKAT